MTPHDCIVVAPAVAAEAAHLVSSVRYCLATAPSVDDEASEIAAGSISLVDSCCDHCDSPEYDASVVGIAAVGIAAVGIAAVAVAAAAVERSVENPVAASFFDL